MTTETYFRLATHQSAAYSATAGTITNGVGATTSAIRVVCTTDAFIKIGDGAPVATAADVPVFAGVPEYFDVSNGQKVSAIQQSAAGTLHVTECTH